MIGARCARYVVLQSSYRYPAHPIRCLATSRQALNHSRVGLVASRSLASNHASSSTIAGNDGSSTSQPTDTDTEVSSKKKQRKSPWQRRKPLFTSKIFLQPNLTLRGFIDIIADSPNYSKIQIYDLHRSLLLPCDPPSLLLITPMIYKHLSNIPPSMAISLLIRLSDRFASHGMISPFHGLTDLIIKQFGRFEDEVTKKEGWNIANINQMRKWFHKILESANLFSTDNNQWVYNPDAVLPSLVSEYVYRLLVYYLDWMDNLPTTSDLSKRQSLGKNTIKKLIQYRFVTPQIREMVLDHVKDRKINLGPEEYHLCMLSAVREGNRVLAEEFLGEKQRCLEVKRFWRTKKNDDSFESMEVEGTITEEPKAPSKWHLDLPGLGVAEEDDKWSDKIDQLIVKRTGRSLQHLATTLGPFLEPDPPPDNEEESEQNVDIFRPSRANDISVYAWSLLLDRLSQSSSTTPDDIASFRESLPPGMFVAQTVTPLMQCFTRLGQPEKAWELWLELVDLESRNATVAPKQEEDPDPDPDLTQTGTSRPKGTWVDRIALAEATRAIHALEGLPPAVKLLDDWATRSTHPLANEPHRIDIDAQNVNVLLNCCKASKSPSVALRLWTAATPRWGVRLDTISLNIILDISRFYKSQEEDSVGSRLRALAHQFRFRSTPRGNDPGNAWTEYEADGFSRGDTSVLLDTPESTWESQYQVEPWQVAQDLFTEIVHTNFPHVEDLPSPFDHGFHLPFSFWGSASTDDTPPDTGRYRCPTTKARYTHIIPNATSFHSYITLLGYNSQTDQIPIAFTWAKSLGIKPHWQTMCSALTAIAEVEGPRRRMPNWGTEGEAKLVRDEEIMRRWLERWLGDGFEKRKDGSERKIVPDEQDVAKFRRSIVEKKEPISRV